MNPNKDVSVALSVVLAIILLAMIATILGAQDIIQSAKTASKSALILAAFVYIISLPIRGIRYQHILLRLNNQQSVKLLTETILISQSANVVLPARIGDVMRAYILKRARNIPLTTGFSSLAIERVFDIVAITAIGAVAAYITAANIELNTWITSTIYTAGGVIVLLFIVLFGISLTRDSFKLIKSIVYKLSRSSDYTDKVANIVAQFVHEISVVAVKPKSFAVILITSLMIWFVDIITCLTVLNAFPGVGISSSSLLALVFLAVAVGNIAKMFPVTPGAIGTYEAALTGVFTLGGIDPVVGFAVAVLDHIIKNSVTLIGGGLALSHIGMKWNDVLTVDVKRSIKK